MSASFQGLKREGATPLRLVAGTFVALLAIGCGRDPVEPSDPPKPPPPTFSISGVVTEAGTAVADASVGVWVEAKGWGGGRDGGHTDAQGRYQVGALPLGALVRLLVGKQGYVQQCAAPPMVIQADASVDLELVARADLTASSRQSAPGFRTVTGMVGEMTQPPSNRWPGCTWVSCRPFWDVSAAFTFTDSSGRFALCGLPSNEPVGIGPEMAAGTNSLPCRRARKAASRSSCPDSSSGEPSALHQPPAANSAQSFRRGGSTLDIWRLVRQRVEGSAIPVCVRASSVNDVRAGQRSCAIWISLSFPWIVGPPSNRLANRGDCTPERVRQGATAPDAAPASASAGRTGRFQGRNGRARGRATRRNRPVQAICAPLERLPP